jgi:hypothetical protein
MGNRNESWVNSPSAQSAPVDATEIGVLRASVVRVLQIFFAGTKGSIPDDRKTSRTYELAAAIEIGISNTSSDR